METEYEPDRVSIHAAEIAMLLASGGDTELGLVVLTTARGARRLVSDETVMLLEGHGALSRDPEYRLVKRYPLRTFSDAGQAWIEAND